MNTKRYQILFFLLIFISHLSVCVAQCRQNGVVLEYNRRQAKKPYTHPVQLNFSEKGNTIATVNDNNGEFVLNFNLSKPGDTINSYRVGIPNQGYMLFNGNRLGGWVISPIKRMEVVLCRQNLLNYLSKTYTNNYVERLKKEYDDKIRKLTLSLKKGELLKNELALAKEQYERDIQQLKLRALLFAYVDETEIDSLEYLWRECILANDIEGATKIGERMNLSEQAVSRTKNIDLFVDRSFEETEKAWNLANIMEQHIVNSKLTNRQWRDINPYYVSLIRLYEKLIDVYQNRLRCSDDFLDNLKRRAGDVMTEYGDTLGWHGIKGVENKMFWLRKAADLGNVSALYRLGEEEEDFSRSLSYLMKAEAEAERQKIFTWKYWPTIMTREDLAMSIESYPDFCYVQNGDSLFFHILDEKRVALSFIRHHNKASSKIVIPEKVKFKKRKYSVTKIVSGAFTHTSGAGMQKKNNPFGNDFPYRNENPYANLKEVTLPNSIDTIGMTALGAICNVPRNLKKIGSWNQAFGAINGVVELPEGLESIGCISFPDSVKVILPSTLKEVDFDLFARYTELNKKNKYFCQINGAVYSADSSKVLVGTVGKSFYIPKNLKVDLGWFKGARRIAEDIDTFVLEKGSKYYSEYEKALYTKDFDTLLFVGKTHQPELKLHPRVKKIYDIHLFPSRVLGIRNLYIEGTDNVGEICNFIKETNGGYGIEHNFNIYFFGEPLILRPHQDGHVMKQVQAICQRHLGDNRFSYLNGQMCLSYGDIEGADSCLQSINGDAELAIGLRQRIVLAKDKYNDFKRLATEAYNQMKDKRADFNSSDPEQNKEIKHLLGEIGGYVFQSLQFIEKELHRHPDNAFLYELLGLYQLNRNEKKEADILMKKFKEINPKYETTEFYKELYGE